MFVYVYVDVWVYVCVYIYIYIYIYILNIIVTTTQITITTHSGVLPVTILMLGISYQYFVFGINSTLLSLTSASDESVRSACNH